MHSILEEEGSKGGRWKRPLNHPCTGGKESSRLNSLATFPRSSGLPVGPPPPCSVTHHPRVSVLSQLQSVHQHGKMASAMDVDTPTISTPTTASTAVATSGDKKPRFEVKKVCRSLSVLRSSLVERSADVDRSSGTLSLCGLGVSIVVKEKNSQRCALADPGNRHRGRQLRYLQEPHYGLV